MQQYYQHGHSLLVEFTEFRVFKLDELAVAVRSNVIRLYTILKLVINVCQSVDLAVVMFIANNFIEERLVPNFIGQGHALVIVWIFHEILLTKPLLLIRSVELLAENVPVGSLNVDWGKWEVRDLRHLQFWSVELGSVLQRFVDELVIVEVVGCSQDSGRSLFTSFRVNRQNSLLDRDRHNFEFAHYFQNLSSLLLASLEILLRKNRLVLRVIFVLFLINFG